MHLLIALALVTASAQSREPCVHDAERRTVIAELPASWQLELVGISFDRRFRRTAIIRNGKLSNVYREGDVIHGRLRILAVGQNSILVRADNTLFTLRLRNRATRNWQQTVSTLPLCP